METPEVSWDERYAAHTFDAKGRGGLRPAPPTTAEAARFERARGGLIP